MYVLFLIEIYELLESFFGVFPHGMTRPENILKCDKCATEHIEIQKSFSLW